ncbi:monovalent cation/H+ antiporter subunit A [Silanimonas lenta]|uniref:monovalent cation/H+ antiporter subunit A n=1 Tax=Silanimonas lenta TaxID=265429 RepID=UPI0012EB9A3E|nr:monovalent cation/H+ antiporter subunit A [Silanimonas lenta]
MRDLRMVDPMLSLMLAAPFLAAFLLVLMPGAGRARSALVAGVGALVGLTALTALAPAVFAGEVLRTSVEWMPQVGLALSLRLDGFAWMFALLVLGIGALVVLYAHWYLAEDDPPRRFFATLSLFMGAMLGVVVSGNLLLMVVFWELTSIASFLLIGFWNGERDARRGARMALAITGAGGLALLAGVLMLGRIAGSFELDVVLASAERLQAHPLYLPALACVLLGAFTKSAQFPFHFWLPHAMAAPTPVSAYLHSATMVKCGVFLLARLHPALAGSEEWFLVVSGIGLATLLVGSFLAIFQQDLKGLLAYSTISHLGLITLLFGMGTPMALVAGVFHILNHATFKASLFMAAGIIDHETGTRDFRRLHGLAKYMPITAALAVVASLAMAGVPLFNGFLSKEMFLTETLNVPRVAGLHLLIPGLSVLAAAFSVAYSIRFIKVFFGGEPKCEGGMPHEPPRFMRVPVEVLVLIVLAVGLLPNLTIGELLAVGAAGALGAPLPEYHLAIWHGFNLPFVMSLLGLVGGAALWAVLHRAGALHEDPRASYGRRGFDRFVAALVAVSRAITRRLAVDRLPAYLGWMVLVLIVAAAVAFAEGSPAGPRSGIESTPTGIVLWAIGLAAALAVAVRYRQRVFAVLAAGFVGLVVALTFLVLSAPDLALTQLLVEALSLLLLLLALRYLPQEAPPERRPLRAAWHGLLAVGSGLGVGALAYALLTRPSTSISEYYLRTAVPEGGGTNVVNVILVDYRALDTLGEISVVGIVGLIVAALLARARPQALAPEGRGRRRPTLMLQVAAQWLLPLGMVVSVYFFLRGHNAPGGGFIAALALVSALYLHTVGHGSAQAEKHFPLDWTAWIGWGLLLAIATGLGAFAFGHPFLTSSTPHLTLPLIGELHLASAMAFDTGVYLVVTGSVMLTLVLLTRLLRSEPNA